MPKSTGKASGTQRQFGYQPTHHSPRTHKGAQGPWFARLDLSAALPGPLYFRDVVALAPLAGEERGSLIIADDLFCLGVPADRAAQSGGDPAEVAGVHRLHVAEHVGNRQPALANATEEVVFVAFVRLAL